MRKDILIIVNSENNKVKIDNKTLGITSENLQGKIIFKPEPFVDGVCRLYVDGKGSILMDKQEDCYTVNILSSLLTEDSLDVCFKITEPETEDGIPIFCSKIMHFRVLETIDSSSTIPEDYPSWEQVLDSMMAKVEQMESDAEDRLDEVVGQIQDLTSAYNSNATNKTNEFNTNATNKTTAFNQNYASKVTEIDGAVNSAKTELDDYTEDKKDEIDGSVDDLKSELDTYETAKEGELDSHTSTKKTELNTYTNSKKSDLDDYEETKETSLNTLAGNLTSAFNSNANSKTSDFNDNATSKTGDFNTNATNKTTDFNTNATTKTSEFDQNASDKTDDFDDNASAKTTAFNNNATAKIAEYDAHVTELQSQVDDLTTLVETELESNEVEGTEIDVSDSAEYRGRIEVKGNTYQKQLSGKNFYGINDYEGTFKNVTIKIKDGEMTLNGTANGTGTLYIEPKNEQIFDGTYTIVKNLISGTQTGSGNINLRNANDDTVIDGTQLSLGDNIRTFTINNTSIKYGIYLMNGVTFNNFKIRPQIVVGNTPDYDFEPYCGGQASPNPDYPQEIKVVTGDNDIKHVGKNLFNYITNFRPSGNGLTNILNSDGSISVSGTPNSQYTRVVNETDITDILKDNTTYTASQSIFRTDEKNVSIEIKRSRADESTSNVKVSNNSNKVSFTVDKSEFVRYTISFLTNTVQPLNFTTTLQLEEGTTPTTYEPYKEEEYKLDLWKENEFDSENASVIEALLKGSNVTLISNSHERTIIIPCKKNITYKISKREGSRLRVAEFDEEPQIDSTGRNIKINDYGTELIYSTTTGSYLAIGFYFTDTDSKICTVEEMLATIKIQEAIELCKIGDYQDILFKNVVGDENYNSSLTEGAWYKKNVVGKYLGSSDLTSNGMDNNRVGLLTPELNIKENLSASVLNQNSFCNLLQTILVNNTGFDGTTASKKIRICVSKKYVSTFSEAKELLADIVFYYVQETPTYTQITNPTLISQLEALRKAKWFKGVNHWWTETANLKPNLKGTYKQSNNLRLQALEQAVVALGGV